MSNHKAVSRDNTTVEEQFGIHKIKEHLNIVDNFTMISRRSGNKWLTPMIIKLHKKMDEIQIHAENAET